jgi:hypothetical protein
MLFVSKKKYEESQELAEFYKALLERERESLAQSFSNVEAYRRSLSDIVAQETAAPNATVTRILNIAKKALGQ